MGTPTLSVLPHTCNILSLGQTITMEPGPSLALLLLLLTCVTGLTVSADTGADLVEDAEEAGGLEADHVQLHSADGDDPLVFPWVHRRYKRRIYGDYDTLPAETRMRKMQGRPRRRNQQNGGMKLGQRRRVKNCRCKREYNYIDEEEVVNEDFLPRSRNNGNRRRKVNKKSAGKKEIGKNMDRVEQRIQSRRQDRRLKKMQNQRKKYSGGRRKCHC